MICIEGFPSGRPSIFQLVNMSRQSSANSKVTTAFAVLFAVSAAHLLNDMIQSVIPALYPIIKDEFGFTFAQIGIITFVFQMTSSILQPFVGRYADRHPSPYALTLGMMFTLAGLVLLTYASGFGGFLLAVSVVGWGSSIFHPEASRVAQLAAGDRKGLAQSIFQVGGNGGSAIGPLLAALIVIPYGRGATIWFTVAAVIGALLVARIGLWYSRRLAVNPHIQPRDRGLADALPARKIRMAMLILVVLVSTKNFFTSCMTSYFTFYLIEKFGMSIRDAQLCLFAFLAAMAAGIVVGGIVGDRYGRKLVIWLSILGAAPFALMMPFVGMVACVILAVISGFVISSAFSAILVYATELKPGKVGMIAGLFFGLAFGLGGIGAAFFGWLADKTSIEFIFHVSTVLPLLGIIAAWLPNVKAPKKVLA